MRFDPPKVSGEEERKYLMEHVVKPMQDFALEAVGGLAQERQRANGVVAKVEAFNQAVKPRKKLFGVF